MRTFLLGLLVLVGFGSAPQPGLVPATLLAQTGAGGVQAVVVARPEGAVVFPQTQVAARAFLESRLQADALAVASFRPAYPFRQHIFTIPDGRIVFGSARDGRLLAVFPSTGDWTRDAVWQDPTLTGLLWTAAAVVAE